MFKKFVLKLFLIAVLPFSAYSTLKDSESIYESISEDIVRLIYNKQTIMFIFNKTLYNVDEPDQLKKEEHAHYYKIMKSMNSQNYYDEPYYSEHNIGELERNYVKNFLKIRYKISNAIMFTIKNKKIPSDINQLRDEITQLIEELESTKLDTYNLLLCKINLISLDVLATDLSLNLLKNGVYGDEASMVEAYKANNPNLIKNVKKLSEEYIRIFELHAPKSKFIEQQMLTLINPRSFGN